MVCPGSGEAMEMLFERAKEDREPVFSYYWAPTALAGDPYWYLLEEPEYNGTIWEEVVAAADDETLRPVDAACAYPSFPLTIIVYSGLEDKAPDVVDMLSEFTLGLQNVNELLAWAKENRTGEGWREVAVHYLRGHEDTWSTWVTNDAYDNIMTALEAEP